MLLERVPESRDDDGPSINKISTGGACKRYIIVHNFYYLLFPSSAEWPACELSGAQAMGVRQQFLRTFAVLIF